jgi:P-type Mg2+ transporter
MTGLTSIEAKLIQKQNGYNTINSKADSAISILFNQFKSPILYLLFLCLLVTIFQKEIIESLFLLILLIINTSLGFFQEYKSNKLSNSLKGLINHSTIALRDGVFTNIDSKELVNGDVIKLSLGDIIPADCKVIETKRLLINESILTGESLDIDKLQGDQVFSGTYVKQGSALALITHTGLNTKFGKISKLAITTHKPSAFNTQMALLSKGFLLIGLIFLVSILALHILLGKVENFSETLVFILALTISIVPESLPIVTSLALNSKALEVGEKGLIVKHTSTIEDLGNMDVFCTDKTGTITNNSFSIVPQNYSQKLIDCATKTSLNSNDSFSSAINKEYTTKLDNTLFEDIAFDPNHRYSGKIDKNNNKYYAGSPKEILQLCKSQQNFIDEELLKINNRESDGIKCLCYAFNSEYLGFIEFRDELKPDAIDFVNSCRDQKVKLVILTGDTYNIAKHIGYESTIINDDSQILNAENIDWNNTPDFNQINIIARCKPEDKFKIIDVFQKDKVVGYLGDGINDAPALKKAQIGIVVNTASDIARDAADIIMTNSNLTNLIIGIKSGRVVYENINKYLKITLSSSFGNFFTMGVLSLILPYSPMLGLQVILTDLLTDLPLTSIATDNVPDEDIRRPKHQNLNRLILICLILGIISCIFDFIFLGFNIKKQEGIVQTSWFLFSILTELLVLFSIRSRLPILQSSKPQTKTIVFTIIVLILSLLIAMYGFRFINITTISGNQALILLIIAMFYFVINEIVKSIYYKMYQDQKFE